MAAFALQAACFFLGTQQLGVQDVVGAQGDHDGVAHTAFVLGKLLAIVHQTGHGYRLFVFGIVHLIVLELILEGIGGKVGVGFGQGLRREDLDVVGLFHHTAVKLRILQSDGRVQVADVLVRGHLGKFFAKEGITDLLTALDVFPKGQTFLEILILQNGVGANDRGTDIVASQLLHKGGRHIGHQRHADALDAAQSVRILGVEIHIKLGHLPTEW